jgi:hypothetical protein
MRRKYQRTIIYFIILICVMLYSCSEPLGIYIDIKKQAIVSCDGEGLKEIGIESDFSGVKLEGRGSIIYFNEKNDVFRTSLYGDVVYDYVLKLRPNCSYVVTKYNGYDRGPFKITFKTDAAGKVIKASDENCN